jgi:hypothetical protein
MRPVRDRSATRPKSGPVEAAKSGSSGLGGTCRTESDEMPQIDRDFGRASVRERATPQASVRERATPTILYQAGSSANVNFRSSATAFSPTGPSDSSLSLYRPKHKHLSVFSNNREWRHRPSTSGTFYRNDGPCRGAGPLRASGQADCAESIPLAPLSAGPAAATAGPGDSTNWGESNLRLERVVA